MQQGVFVVGLLNDVRQNLPRPTLLPWQQKFKTKKALTRLLLKISPRFLHTAGVFGV